jgi:tetratricopeptide (TPR) repeat protein
MRFRWLAGACGALLVAGWAAGAAAEEAPETDDWPHIISKLRREAFDQPGHKPVRRQLAIAYNNYGVALSEQGEWSQAEAQFHEAMRFDQDNSQVTENLSHVYLNQAHDAYRRFDMTAAVQRIDKALGINPQLTQAHVLLGKIEYDRQRLKEAKAAWTKALQLEPDRADVKEFLDRVTEELPVEGKFERLAQSYFDLRYEEQLERPVGFDIRDALSEARRSVGSDFAYWPKYKIVVLIYSAESFRKMRAETPEWMAGQFDGKIRVPLPSAGMDPNVVRAILFHEYTHALIHDLTQGKCPTWLNEGLAEYEGRKHVSQPLWELEKAAQGNRLIPWLQLSEAIAPNLPTETVRLGYEQSYSVVTYLVDRYGLWRMRRLLKAIATGQSWDAAVAEELHIKLPRLEANWRDVLPQHLRSAKQP